MLVQCLPSTRFYALKRLMWRFGGVDIGRGVRLVSSVRIWTSGPVAIGEDTFIGHECLIVGGDARITIGARGDLAPRVSLVSGTHDEGSAERAAGSGRSEPITIGDGVWIGTGAAIIAGGYIGDGSIIGASSLVNTSVPAGVVAVGVPCRVLRTRQGDGRSADHAGVTVDTEARL
jgi:maltose O-acetyltransferase